ncbi:MAG: triphosphoribosyl-dephospho-CoA synthase [Prevotella sp.]|nr:triphosphoribosyl-dephospho-CoA synthase [Prevotella sp.]
MVDYEIHSVPLSVPLWRRKVERFLEANQLRLDEVDYYAIVTEPDGSDILAGGGLQGDIIKCIAVSEQLRDAHLSNRLISHLMSEAAQRGHHSVKVFTKPQNRQVFESLGFRLVGEAPLAILMENGHGIDDYTKYLRNASLSLPTGATGVFRAATGVAATPQRGANPSFATEAGRGGAIGIIVMNANPFTLGHRYLIEQAAQQVDRLFIIPVQEDRSLFPYTERKAMIEQQLSTLTPSLRGRVGVGLLSGSPYAISAATFPTYFLKQLSDAADTQMLLDIDIFRRHIAPALGATVRIVGSEPADPLTRRYNELLKQQLPCVKEIERKQQDGTAISASTVRKALAEGRFADAAALVPATTIPYLLAHLACDALQQELDTTPKPGLVDLHDNGAHADMDHRLMQRSIQTLRPYFIQLAEAGMQGRVDHPTISAIGIAAERDMLAATGGVNTHRGALFSMGLAVVAAAEQYATSSTHHIDKTALQTAIARLARQFPDTRDTHGSQAVSQYQAKGALAMAREGYKQLFSDWLPFFRGEGRVESGKLKTLLRIMSQLDDTNILYRCGAESANRVKADAAELLARFSIDGLQAMNLRYTTDHISPGGSADMLALTIFIHAIMTT